MDGSTVFFIILAIVVIAGVATLFQKKFTCQCGKALKIWGVDSCPACFRYYKKDGDRIRELGPGTVENSPVFAVRRSRIPGYPDRWNWPDYCSVCFAQPARYDNLIVTHVNFIGGEMHGKNFTVKIPYCKAHSTGVLFGNAANLNATDTDKTSILFRSYDYWQMFMQANGVKRPE